MRNNLFAILILILCLSCKEEKKDHITQSSKFKESQPLVVDIMDSLDSSSKIIDTCMLNKANSSTHSSYSSNSSASGYRDIEPNYFQKGYDDGYQDGSSLEKGRSYDSSLKGEDAREYRRGYFTGYPDGRADNDTDDKYLTGKNNADYYDTRDDDDCSEAGDFDDEDDGW